jgi:hypothetical protein
VTLTPDRIWADLDAWKARARELHHEPYPLYRDFYAGGDRPLAYIRKNARESDEHWLERLGRLVGANYCAPIVNKPVQAEYGSGVRRSVADPDLQARLDAIARRNRLHTFQLTTARQRAIDGTAIVQVYWDAGERKSESGSRTSEREKSGEQQDAPRAESDSDFPLPTSASGALRLKHILPEHFFPVVTDDAGRIDAVIIDRRDGAASSPTSDFPLPTSRVEVYTPHDIAIYEGGERVNPPTGYGALPFVLFHGRRLVGEVFGHSMLRGVAELNHALNESINNILEILRFQAFSLLVIQGGLHGLPLDEDGRPKLAIGEAGFLNVDAEGRVYFADPNPKIGEVLAVIDRLIAMMYETGSIPTAVVQPQQDHAESAAARQVQFMPLVDLVAELQTFDAESERELIEKALLIDAVHRTGPTTLDAIRERAGKIEVGFPKSVLPVDETARFQLAQAKRQAGLLTRKMMLREAHPELAEEELDAILDEIERDS